MAIAGNSGSAVRRDGWCSASVDVVGCVIRASPDEMHRADRTTELGHELRRPEADLLRDGIHELRVRQGRVNFRMLYFFHGGNAVISHGLTKEDAVPDVEIDRALRRKAQFENDPKKHTYQE